MAEAIRAGVLIPTEAMRKSAPGDRADEVESSDTERTSGVEGGRLTEGEGAVASTLFSTRVECQVRQPLLSRDSSQLAVAGLLPPASERHHGMVERRTRGMDQNLFSPFGLSSPRLVSALVRLSAFGLIKATSPPLQPSGPPPSPRRTHRNAPRTPIDLAARRPAMSTDYRALERMQTLLGHVDAIRSASAHGARA